MMPEFSNFKVRYTLTEYEAVDIDFKICGKITRDEIIKKLYQRARKNN